MNNEELDAALRSLSTPPPRLGFWNVVDDAIAESELGDPIASGDDVVEGDDGVEGVEEDGAAENETDDQSPDDNVVVLLPTETERPPWHQRFGSQLTAVAASLVILIGFLWLLNTRPDTIDVAGQPGSAVDPEDLNPDLQPLDIETVGRSVVEIHPDVTPSVEPVFADINGDGADDAAMVVTGADASLAVVTVDGESGDVSPLASLPGDELGTFAVRPGRIIVTTTDAEMEFAVELVPVADVVTNLTVDRRRDNQISDWNIQIAGAGNLGLTPEVCEFAGEVMFEARTAAGTLVSIDGNSGQPYLLVDGPEGSFEGAITIETLDPFKAVGSFTAADDSVVGAVTQITIGGPGC